MQALLPFLFSFLIVRNVQVVEERWGSLGQLTVSVASQRAAPSHAHLHAIKSRKKEITDDDQAGLETQSAKDIEKVTL